MVNVLKEEKRWMFTDELIVMFYDESKCNRSFRNNINKRLRYESERINCLECDRSTFNQVRWRAVV